VKRLGHDGVIIFLDGVPAEIVAFRPEQIKSAIGNSGAFDPDHPDITKAAAPRVVFVKASRAS